MVAATAVKFVIKSFPSSETRNTEAEKRTINVRKYTFTERIISKLLASPARTKGLLENVLSGKTSFHEAAMVWDELQIFMWEQVFLKNKTA